VSPALADFLFEAANFLLLAAVLGWVLFKPVRNALDAERERHTAEAQEDERRRAEAQSLLAEARATREAADREAAEQRRRSLEAAREEAARLLEEARKTRADERRALEQEIATSRDEEALALADAVGRIAAGSVERLLDLLDGPALDTALVRAACAELDRLPRAARASALVESARPLDAEAKRLLEAALGAGFGERTVGGLHAGVRVTTSAGQVDASAAAIARRAARALSAAGATEQGDLDG
jgi:F0F1-type ATP synthase membrane subunit b/b'